MHKCCTLSSHAIVVPAAACTLRCLHFQNVLSFACPQLFITIVRYVLPSEDHTVQKLLLLYLVRSLIRYTRRDVPVPTCVG